MTDPVFRFVTLCCERTLKELNVDVNKLDLWSHTRVYVKCNKCGEEFLREFSHTDDPHMCLYEPLNYLALPRCECKLIDENAKLPVRSKCHDAGLDISSAVDITIQPRTTAEISTGVIICAPPGYYFTVEGRSGLFRKGVFPLRGIIDASYQACTNIALFNSSKESYEIKCGDRIAQLLLHKVHCPDIVMVNAFTHIDGGRYSDGYGSTGR